MNPKLRRTGIPSRTLVIGICLLFLVVGIRADGPTNIVAGLSIASDTGDVAGEQWGRPQGRTIVYGVSDTSVYDTLSFGATSVPTAAFDNQVNAAGEIMTFDPSSNLANGQARWLGTAFLPLAPGQPLASQNIQTRFTMTIKNGSNAGIAMANFSGGPTPGIDVKTAGSSFSVNLIFEAFAPAGFQGAGTWVPFLDFYDAAPTVDPHTPHDQGGPALTGFSRGFYFTNEGMTLEEHDANITAKIAALSGQVTSVKGDTSFTRAEVTGGLHGLDVSLGALTNTVNNDVKPNVNSIQNTTMLTQSAVQQTQQKVNDLYSLVQNQPPLQIPQDIARKADVDNAKNSISDLVMILMGLKPCPLPADQCAAFTFMPQVARQTTLEEVRQTANAASTGVTQISNSLAAMPLATAAQLQPSLSQLASQASVSQLSANIAGLPQATAAQVQQALGPVASQASVNLITSSLTSMPQAVAAQVQQNLGQVASQSSVNQISTAIGALPPAATLAQVQQALGPVATAASVSQIMSAINALPAPATLAQVEQALALLATNATIEQLKQRLIDLAAVVDGINTAVATPEKSLDVQVVELTDKDSPKRRRWLLRITLNGAPVSAQLTSLVAISANKKQASTATQVLSLTATAQLMPGLLEVVLDVPESDVKDMSFQFSVRHTPSGGGTFDAGALIGSSK